MTPELRTSCEVVFQEHKTSAYPITWNKEPFRGRMSVGLCEMAKETLVQKKIIYFPKLPRKTTTILNPVVATACSFEEAIAMIEHKTQTQTSSKIKELPVSTNTAIPEFNRYTERATAQLVNNNGTPETVITSEKWYLKPLFFYVVWPVSAAIVSVLIAHFMSVCVEMTYR
jgi:hypothetical protein